MFSNQTSGQHEKALELLMIIVFSALDGRCPLSALAQIKSGSLWPKVASSRAITPIFLYLFDGILTGKNWQRKTAKLMAKWHKAGRHQNTTGGLAAPTQKEVRKASVLERCLLDVLLAQKVPLS
jgi:hypothetical protein